MELGSIMLHKKKKKLSRNWVTLNMKSPKKQNLYYGSDLAPFDHSLEPKFMTRFRKDQNNLSLKSEAFTFLSHSSPFFKRIHS